MCLYPAVLRKGQVCHWRYSLGSSGSKSLCLGLPESWEEEPCVCWIPNGLGLITTLSTGLRSAGLDMLGT